MQIHEVFDELSAKKGEDGFYKKRASRGSVHDVGKTSSGWLHMLAVNTF